MPDLARSAHGREDHRRLLCIHPFRLQLQDMFGVRPSYRRVRWLFLRGLGAVSYVAFRSLRAQVIALYGERGLTPLKSRLDTLESTLRRRLIDQPSVLWWGSSDRALVRTARAGEGI